MEEVEQLIRKHVIFQRVLALQDKKVMGLNIGADGGVSLPEGLGGCMLRNRAHVSVERGIDMAQEKTPAREVHAAGTPGIIYLFCGH